MGMQSPWVGMSKAQNSIAASSPEMLQKIGGPLGNGMGGPMGTGMPPGLNMAMGQDPGMGLLKGKAPSLPSLGGGDPGSMISKLLGR